MTTTTTATEALTSGDGAIPEGAPEIPPAVWALGAHLNGAVTALGIHVGHRAGLLELAAVTGPATSDELAAAGGLSERHVREWLGLMTVSGIFGYDPSDRRYTLPEEVVPFLVGDSPWNMARVMSEAVFFAKFAPDVVRTIREGGGIPYEATRPDFTALMDEMSRSMYDATLLDSEIAAVDGLTERLTEGVAVCDIGCGTGHAINVMARAFPASTFVGYDRAEDALEAARKEAAEWGLRNVRFVACDVANLPEEASYDVVTAFDAIHDQARPRQVLAEIRRVLAPGGVFVMLDVTASSNLEDNIGNPMAPFLYASSLFHCMQVSLAEGGEGLGTVWGEQKARELLAEAGFDRVTIAQPPMPNPVNTIYVCEVSD